MRLFIYLSVLYIVSRQCSAISGGHSVTSSRQYPFSVTLTDPILCGGSLISLRPPWILTAAHCIENYVANDTPSVRYGSRSFKQQATATIRRTILHPMYTNDSILYDMALIELTEPLAESHSVQSVPILLDDRDVMSFETIGMGYTGYNEPHSEFLQSAFCNRFQSLERLKNDHVNQSVLFTVSNAGLCHGDSGSPLLYKSKYNDYYYLSGILNRIFNAYDPDPNFLSCPFHESNMSQFLNMFIKPSSHLQWIMETTQLDFLELTSLNENTASQQLFLSKASIISLFFLSNLYILLSMYFILFSYLM